MRQSERRTQTLILHVSFCPKLHSPLAMDVVMFPDFHLLNPLISIKPSNSRSSSPSHRLMCHNCVVSLSKALENLIDEPITMFLRRDKTHSPCTPRETFKAPPIAKIRYLTPSRTLNELRLGFPNWFRAFVYLACV